MTAEMPAAWKEISDRQRKRLENRGPNVMKVAQVLYDEAGNDLIRVYPSARTTNAAISEIEARVMRLRVVKMRYIYITSASWEQDRVPVLETLLNANSNALAPGGWSWELRERYIDRDGNVATRTQLFQAPPATARYIDQAKVEWQPVYHLPAT